MSILDLPDLPLDCILELLPPSELCTMARVCSSLRERCVSDHLWEKHLKTKWGKILGPSAHKEWQCYLSSPYHLDSPHHQTSHLGGDIHLLSLETGRFWFPAQVYNRENGHVGFMLSCYDAELSYDTDTNTFQARYPPHGKRAIAVEKDVTWERIRAAPVDASPHNLYVSDSLNELKPGDHIEIQWRRNKEFPYEMMVLEFNQYTVGSRWRKTMINRRDHREKGNEEDGFYGGIRKINCKEDIEMWKRLWPSSILE
ncbi:unnamed protein product [Arabidopsis thaliana]|uniref:F-box domain-containing protein n=1 Tax=Arabidopsis thaliana TaxID=3702 RepID=A0A654EXY5_ARATH|nr:unnamed protein product [Arabidopsis thaliana]